jgi:hypothetical protein
MADPSRRSTRFSMRSKQLGQLLLENGDVTAEQVAGALKQQEENGGLLGQILVANGECADTCISAALLKQVQVTDVKCDELSVSPEIIALVPRETCEAERLCPFEKIGNLLCLVMGNPLNRKAITQIEESTRLKVKSFKSVWPKINELIQRSYEAVPEEAPAEDAGGGEPLDIAGESDGLSLTMDDTTDHSLSLDNDAGTGLEESPGIVEIPPVIPSKPVAAPRATLATGSARKPRQPEAPAQAKISGFDKLDDANAEMIEVNKRGLTQRTRKDNFDDAPVAPKPAKIAKVNVDLDALDINSGEVVAGAADENEEAFEEIAPTAVFKRSIGEPMSPVKMLDDNYFYTGGPAPKGARSDELLDLIEKIPVAAVVAESIGDYESQEREKAAKAVKVAQPPVMKPSVAMANRPLELQPSPEAVMTAVLISEIEFQKHVANLGEDPVGEWDWLFAAPGPVLVHEYEEN